jgi:uridine kinase
MDRPELLSLLCTKVLSTRRENRPLKVAIDGRCGSGKSTLAEELASALSGTGLRVLRVSADAFHHSRAYRYRQGEDSARGYYEDAFDYGAIVERLLKPLSGDSFPALCSTASLDLETDTPVDMPVTVSADAILLFDGVFALRKELRAYWDLRLLINVNAATAVSRAVLRDAGATVGIERKYEVRYEPAWLLYESGERPDAKADLVIDNSEPLSPLPSVR